VSSYPVHGIRLLIAGLTLKLGVHGSYVVVSHDSFYDGNLKYLTYVSDAISDVPSMI